MSKDDMEGDPIETLLGALDSFESYYVSDSSGSRGAIPEWRRESYIADDPFAVADAAALAAGEARQFE